MPMTTDGLTQQPTPLLTQTNRRQTTTRCEPTLIKYDNRNHQPHQTISHYKNTIVPDFPISIYHSKGDLRRARMAKSVRFSHENIVHRYCPAYCHIDQSHKSPNQRANHSSKLVLRNITNMTNSSALRQLELAKTRK